MNCWILVIPIVTAVLGWLIHKFAGFYILKNYWPKMQAKLSREVGAWAASQLSFDQIEQKISDPSILDKAMPTIESHIDTFLNEKLQQEIPMLSMFVGTKTTEKIKDVFITQLKQLFPAVMVQMAESLKENFNIESILSKKLNEKSFQQLTEKKIARQLSYLPKLGFVTGLIAGLVSLLIFWILGNIPG